MLEFEMQVGDQVLVKHDLKESDNYPCGVTEEMASMAGQICTVKKIIRTEVRYQVVLFEEDAHEFSWSTPMLEGLANSDNFYFLRRSNILVELRDGKLMLRYKNSIISPNGFAIGIDKYDGAKHQIDSKFDIVKVYAPSTTNYKFDKGECLWEESVEEEASANGEDGHSGEDCEGAVQA